MTKKSFSQRTSAIWIRKSLKLLLVGSDRIYLVTYRHSFIDIVIFALFLTIQTFHFKVNNPLLSEILSVLDSVVPVMLVNSVEG